MTTTLHIRFATDPSGLDWHAKLEAELAALVRSAGLDENAGSGVKLAVVEAINNVIEHAYLNTAGKPIELRGHDEDGRLTLVLRDRGLPMPLPLPDGSPVDPMAESGRGWQIIRAAFPDVRYERTDGENALTLIRPLSATDPVDDAGPATA